MQVIDIPSEWRPLRFGNQEGTPTLWVEVDPSKPTKARIVWLAFTGDWVPDQARHVGTEFFGQGDAIVIHCYVR